jgi:TatA/E family protein of Tat protein translocase
MDGGLGNIGATEILLIAVVALLLFGAGRIADIGKGLGEGLRKADGDAARNAAIAFAVALAICWLAVSTARHR